MPGTQTTGILALRSNGPKSLGALAAGARRAERLTYCLEEGKLVYRATLGKVKRGLVRTQQAFEIDMACHVSSKHSVLPATGSSDLSSATLLCCVTVCESQA